MNDLNFFESYQSLKKEKDNNNIYIYGAAAFVCIMIASTLLFNGIKILLLNSKIEKYTKELEKPEIQEELREANMLNRQIDILNEYDSKVNKIINKINKRDNVSTNLLLDINSTIASETVFKNITIVKNTVVIQGTSTNRKSIAELQHNLKNLSNMQDVFVSAIDNSGAVQGEYAFNIKCVLKDVD